MHRIWNRRSGGVPVVAKDLNPVRVGVTTFLLLGACTAIVVTVRLFPAEFTGLPFALAGGVLFTIIPASILEWIVHRYVYHRNRFAPLAQIYRIHHRGHHAAIFPTWRYTTNGPVRRHPIAEADVSRLYPPGWRNVISKVSHFAFYMAIGVVCIWTPVWLLTHNVLFLASIIVTSAVLSDLFVRVHDAIHYPGQFRLIEAQPWFRFIERHHFIHHVDMEANINFLLPLADWCYGTLRTELTPDEIARHGTLERPKAQPLGHSEPARLFLAERQASRPGESAGCCSEAGEGGT